MFKIKTPLKLLLILIGLVCSPSLLADEYNWKKFDNKLSLVRGSFYSPFEYAEWLPKNDFCKLVKNEWGWGDCSTIDAFLVNPSYSVNTLVINKPTNDGYIRFDDWFSSDKDEEIEQIENELKQAVKEQSKNTGQSIELLGWHTYPNLNSDKNFLQVSLCVFKP